MEANRNNKATSDATRASDDHQSCSPASFLVVPSTGNDEASETLHPSKVKRETPEALFQPKDPTKTAPSLQTATALPSERDDNDVKWNEKRGTTEFFGEGEKLYKVVWPRDLEFSWETPCATSIAGRVFCVGQSIDALVPRRGTTRRSSKNRPRERKQALSRFLQQSGKHVNDCIQVTHMYRAGCWIFWMRCRKVHLQ